MKEESDRKSLQSGVFSIPKCQELEALVHSFSPAEKVLFWMFAALLVGSTATLMFQVNKFLITEVPAYGGSISEGIVGSPRFINPLLAISDADRDMASLLYSGLMKIDPTGGIIPDLAKSYNISEDGLVYSFTLRDDIVFHDGTPISADDVLFTIQMAQDPTLKSVKRASWDGITAEKISEREINFYLKQPYAPFLQNTTLGILPRHIWKDIELDQFPFSTFNTEPIGSGPYKLESVDKSTSGVPKQYKLSSFNEYALGKPYISNVEVIFYQNEDDLINGYRNSKIGNINSIAPDKVGRLKEEGAYVVLSSLPRIFAVFFNQNQAPVFVNKEVRIALNIGLDKTSIVREILSGYGTVIDSPLPPGVIVRKNTQSVVENTSSTTLTKTEKAIAILEDAGWEYNEAEQIYEKIRKKETQRLEFSLATSNVPELKAAAEIVAKEWEKMGARVTVKIFETGDLNQNVIRPRKYDALLFGEIVGRELDLFAFWHSSQRNDPGLNIALYANMTVDDLLENVRVSSDKKARVATYEAFEEEIMADVPAVFLYSPDFIYIVSPTIQGIELESITVAAERFLNIHKWYIETDKVWHFFE